MALPKANALTIRIEGHDLPGLTCGGSPDFPGYAGIQVAVQRRNRPGELLGPQPGDADAVNWTLDATAKPAAEGGVELTGPHIQGGPGNRFIYLSWGTVLPPDRTFILFRRAKLLLAAVPPEVLTAALDTGTLTGRLGLTDAKGHPLCARVVPPAIDWSAGRRHAAPGQGRA
ncbi:DUF5990 family protein [Streptacidiphilus sp. EB129]|uniref:DUF5990 family protein n=1 Tax=Streptacidiphilus sp. EB129 TaxID=3156262 RepID=UPI00351879F1